MSLPTLTPPHPAFLISINPPPRLYFCAANRALLLTTCVPNAKNFTKIFSALAVVTSLIGTIVVTVNNMNSFKDYLNTLTNSIRTSNAGVSASPIWGDGYSCAIAAVVIQAVAFALEFIPTPAASPPPLKSEPTAVASPA